MSLALFLNSADVHSEVEKLIQPKWDKLNGA